MSAAYSHGIRHEWITFNSISKVRCSAKRLRESASDIAGEYDAPDGLTRHIPRSRSSPDLVDVAGSWRNDRRTARGRRKAGAQADDINTQNEEAWDLPTATTAHG